MSAFDAAQVCRHITNMRRHLSHTATGGDVPYCKPRILGIVSDTKLTCKRGSGAHYMPPRPARLGKGSPDTAWGLIQRGRLDAHRGQRRREKRFQNKGILIIICKRSSPDNGWGCCGGGCEGMFRNCCLRLKSSLK